MASRLSPLRPRSFGVAATAQAPAWGRGPCAAISFPNIIFIRLFALVTHNKAITGLDHGLLADLAFASVSLDAYSCISPARVSETAVAIAPCRALPRSTSLDLGRCRASPSARRRPRPRRPRPPLPAAPSMAPPTLGACLGVIGVTAEELAGAQSTDEEFGEMAWIHCLPGCRPPCCSAAAKGTRPTSQAAAGPSKLRSPLQERCQLCF